MTKDECVNQILIICNEYKFSGLKGDELKQAVQYHINEINGEEGQVSSEVQPRVMLQEENRRLNEENVRLKNDNAQIIRNTFTMGEIERMFKKVAQAIWENKLAPYMVSQQGSEGAGRPQNAGMVDISKKIDELRSNWYTYWYNCPNCHTKTKHINQSFDFCPTCGVKLNWVE